MVSSTSTLRRTQHHASAAAAPTVEDPPNAERKRLNGVWQDGLWWCNCEPRERAVLREVRKDGPNKGKFFWTCATYPFCKFFLWRHEAVVRETGLPGRIDGQPPSPPPRPKTPTLTQQPIESYGVLATPTRRPALGHGHGGAFEFPEYSGSFSGIAQHMTHESPADDGTAAGPVTPGSKRKRDLPREKEADEFSDLDSDEERQLADMTDRSVQKANAHGIADDVFSTPGTIGRTTDMVGGLPTPSVSRNLFPAARRAKTASFDESLSSDSLMTPSKTSSSTRSDANFSEAPEDVTEEVMMLLQGQNLDPAVAQSVRSVLQNASRRTKGIVLGRDTVRSALKERDKKIAKLQDRIRDLENKAAYEKQVVTEAKRKMMDVYDDL